jgi:hypothetical protein
VGAYNTDLAEKRASWSRRLERRSLTKKNQSIDVSHLTNSKREEVRSLT